MSFLEMLESDLLFAHEVGWSSRVAKILRWNECNLRMHVLTIVERYDTHDSYGESETITSFLENPLFVSVRTSICLTIDIITLKENLCYLCL